MSAPLDRFFVDAARESETTVHRVRLVLAVLAWMRLAAFQWRAMAAGEPKHWITTAVLGFVVIASSGMLWIVRRTAHPRPWLVLSPLLDAVFVFGVMLPGLVWPREGYAGVLLQPDFGLWLLVTTGAGFRLSRQAVWGGAAGSFVGVAVLVVVDHLHDAALIRYGPPEIALAALLMAGATGFAFGLDGWMRRLVARGRDEAVQAERARQRLGAYVSNEVAELALREEATLGGVRRDVAIVFSDLRGFTRTGEQVGPDELIAQLNAYLEAMVDAIHAHGGVVDKYMGDAILAVFGVPEKTGDEGLRALRAALDMERALARHNESRASRGLPPLAHGIGVHAGPVIAGHVGTRTRLQYTVIGDTVNVASRLQTATKEVGVSLLVSADALATAGPGLPPMRALEPLMLRGRRAPIAVYTYASPPVGT